ncbi:hexose kinase [Sphingomonas sp. dw_22]|uniref:1-phosphofructokinase family hexose kinase n=1 Tax=Sphingomonas sp. dw_22 TaxID=2721175 RepID=UPI001BD54515
MSIATVTLNPALDITTATEAVRHTHKLRCSEPRFEPGGGGINVARVVHALGGKVTAVFPCGGPMGVTLETLLREAGVPIAPVPIAGATRQSFTVEETSTGLPYRFVLPGPVLGESEIAALVEVLRALPGRPDYIVASGSLPPGCHPRIFRRLADLGKRLVIDTSGLALAACEGVRAYLVKPSLRELEELVGRTLATEMDEAAAARELLERGFAEIVVLSLGERGALLVTADRELRLPAIPVPVANAVGAGDSMVAAITLALARGQSLDEALRYGIAGGAAALLAPGAELVRKEDVERLYAAAGS